MLAALLATTAIVYASVWSQGFINYDTPDYITANPHVKAGLTLAGVMWALTTTWAGNWFPLTWISHMIDVELFGVVSGPLHLVNLSIHLISTAALYVWLRRMTQTRWPSMLVGAFFALHPLHVESVAWLAERKDVLSGLFWMLSLWTYTRYVEMPSRGRYVQVLVCFALGLMSKSMIVTLPAVLLLLDFWPLRRMAPAATSQGPPRAARVVSWRQLVKEKLPFVALALATVVVTFIAQRASGAVATVQTTPLRMRIGNAVLAYGAYLRTAVWPRHLAVFYPYPKALPAAQIALSLAMLLGMSWIAWRTRRTRPYIAVGWCWFLGTLVPVIGLLQVGAQSRADRYMYVPLIGVGIAVAWGLGDLARRPRSKAAISLAAVAACVAFAAKSYGQVHYWQSTSTLFRHAIEATRDNYVAYNTLGIALADQGKTAEAINAYTTSLQIHPDYAEAHGNLAAALLDARRPAEALPHLERAIALKPSLAEPHVNLGAAYDRLGRPDEAEAQYRQVLTRWPDNVDARCGLAIVLAERGQRNEALAMFADAVRIGPDNATAHYDYGNLLSSMSHPNRARAQFEAAVRLKPKWVQAHYNLATILANQGNYEGAIAEYARTLALDPQSAKSENNLGSALAVLGRYAEAIPHLQRAIALAPDLPGARENLQRVVQLAGK